MSQAYNFLCSKEMLGAKPRIGISACLNGEKVRYDGSDKLQPELMAWLQPQFELTPLCPEVAIGMGTPREPIQLIANNQWISAVGVNNSQANYTSELSTYATQVATDHIDPFKPDNHSSSRFCGYVFKSRSPSCGVGSTPLYTDGNHFGFGDGIYAHQIKQLQPWLVVREEDDLEGRAAREQFIFICHLVWDFQLAMKERQNSGQDLGQGSEKDLEQCLGKGLEQFHQHHQALLDPLRKTIQRKLNEYAAEPTITNQQGYLHLLVSSLDEDF